MDSDVRGHPGRRYRAIPPVAGRLTYDVQRRQRHDRQKVDDVTRLSTGSGGQDPSRRAVRWQYSPVPSDVADLRGRVRAALTGWGVVGRLAEDVVLVVSELASNAIEHARTSLVVSLDDGRVRVRVRVRDYSHDRPVLRSVEEDPRRGWGLRMIAQVASWGWKPHSDGKTVWAEIERPPRGLRAVRP